MTGKDSILQIEKQLDNRFSKLDIWGLPFQSILSSAFLTIDNIDLNGRRDVAIDYASRLSYVYQTIAKRAVRKEIINSATAINIFHTSGLSEDFKFLNAYAHFSLLMPQVHRDTYSIHHVGEKHFQLSFISDEMRYAEVMDRIFSYISLQIAPVFRDRDLEEFLSKKVGNGITSLGDEDFHWIKIIYDHFMHLHHAIKVLPPEVFEQMVGVTYDEYFSFVGAVAAHCFYFNILARTYYKKINFESSTEKDEELMNEYMEWVVCCINFKCLGWFIAVSGLSMDRFDKILSYFISIYSNTTGDKFSEMSFCGEGFFPPIILADDSIIFSSMATPFLLNVNNILYSINKMDRKKFDEKISKYLEPTLIAQLEYILSSLPHVKFARNIHYEKGEIDLLVLQEPENACLAIQVKATIAPDSFRAVMRVEDRALEGMEQIASFDALSGELKDVLINKAFGTKLENVKIINILAVRSCAGSVEAWKRDKLYKIVNYAFLAWVVAQKIEQGNLSFNSFPEDLEAGRKTFFELAQWEEVKNTLNISDVLIDFPNLEINMSKLLAVNIKLGKHFKLLNEAVFE